MRKFLACSGLVVLVWVLYAQTGTFEFLRLDDHDYTFRCEFVREGLSWSNIAAAFSNFTHAAIWMPITYVSYMADISLFGPGMGAHHLVNVALHSVTAVLLYFLTAALARRLGAPGRPSLQDCEGIASPTCGEGLIFLAVAFWAVHPQRAEAVAWIAGRKEILCGLFTVAGLLCWLSHRTFVRLVGGCLFCALACMSKPTAMCFPVLALAVEAAGAAAPPGEGRATGRALLRRGAVYLPVVAMAALTGALAIYSQTHAEGYATRDLFSASFSWRLLNAAVAVGLSVYQMVVPAGIHLDYRALPGAFPLHGVLGLSVVIGVLAYLVLKLLGALRDSKTLKGLRTAGFFIRTFFWEIFFFAALLPTLGIFGSFGEHARADRFLYLPMMALPLVVASRCLGNAGARRWLAAIGSLAVLAVLVFAFPVVSSYRNDFTAFSRSLSFDPGHGRALAHVGSEWCARFGKIDKGIDCFRRSQQLRPRDDTAAQLAYALAMRGNSSDFEEIRRLTGKFACDHALDRKGMALEARGLTAMRQKRWEEAISCFADSIRAPQRFYSSEDARLNLAACTCNVGKKAEAEKMLLPLTRSSRADIRSRAAQALETLRVSPSRAYLLF